MLSFYFHFCIFMHFTCFYTCAWFCISLSFEFFFSLNLEFCILICSFISLCIWLVYCIICIVFAIVFCVLIFLSWHTANQASVPFCKHSLFQSKQKICFFTLFSNAFIYSRVAALSFLASGNATMLIKATVILLSIYAILIFKLQYQSKPTNTGKMPCQ